MTKELYETALRRVSFETGRGQRLDAKASMLFGAVGLSLTVTATVGSQLVVHASAVSPVRAIVLGLAALCGLASSACALAALVVNNQYRNMSAGSVFDQAVLATANDAANSKSAPGDDDPAAESYGLMVYQKALIPHLWEIGNANEAANDEKASTVKMAQWLYGGFLLSLAVVCVLIVVGKTDGQAAARSPTESRTVTTKP